MPQRPSSCTVSSGNHLRVSIREPDTRQTCSQNLFVSVPFGPGRCIEAAVTAMTERSISMVSWCKRDCPSNPGNSGPLPSQCRDRTRSACRCNAWKGHSFGVICTAWMSSSYTKSNDVGLCAAIAPSGKEPSDSQLALPWPASPGRKEVRASPPELGAFDSLSVNSAQERSKNLRGGVAGRFEDACRRNGAPPSTICRRSVGPRCHRWSRFTSSRGDSSRCSRGFRTRNIC